MSERSTKRQKELLDFVANFIGEHGYGPSYREVMTGLGYKSVSTVAIHINGLITRGYLRKRDNSARSLEVVSTNLGSLPEQPKATPVKEKWLVEAVATRFDEFEKTKDQRTLDEIYVLIGALKILGLEEAHNAMKSRLTSLA